MSKKIKNLIEKQFGGKFADLEGIAVINPRGLDGNKNNELRKTLHGKGLKMLVVKNTLARRAGATTKIKGFETLLDGPSAVIYGEGSLPNVARLLMEQKKTNETLELRGIFFDGEAYAGEEGVKTVSNFPTREEAIAGIVGALLGAGGGVVSAITGPGASVGSLLSAIEEKAKAAAGDEPAAA